MNTIRIFLASSSELKEERDEFRMFISRENNRLHTKGIYLKVLHWENFIDAISDTRLQDEYNKAVIGADIVLCLFYTKAGKYTQEEFDKALKQFKETGSPLIYTYFKDGAPEPDPKDQRSLDLAAFKKRLSDIGHFYTSYENIQDLKLQFREQLDLLEDKGIIILKKEKQEETADAIANYFSIKNAIVDSAVTAGGDVHAGDKTTNTADIDGDGNVIVHSANGGETTVVHKRKHKIIYHNYSPKDSDFFTKIYGILIGVFGLAALFFLFYPPNLVKKIFPDNYIASIFAGGFFFLASLFVLIFQKIKNTDNSNKN